MKKRIWAYLLTLVMVVGLFPMTASAAGADAWDGTADTDWYNDAENEFHLSTAEELAGLAELVNAGDTFAGQTIYLENDIDLSGQDWVSIGAGHHTKNCFGGTFDGQYHTISYLTSTESDTNHHGLFGVVSSGGAIKNISVTEADIIAEDNSLRAGILADWIAGSSVENCYTSGKIESMNGNKLLGGLVGTCTDGTKVIGCGSDAEVVSNYYDDGDDYSDCDTVGGLIGQWEDSTRDSLISDCWFGGSINCEFEDSGVGGILGANFDFYGEPGVTIRNCMTATKDIFCAEPGSITWIAAVVDSKVTDCFWPDSAPDEVVWDEEDEGRDNYWAVVKLVVDWSQGTAGMDPDFNELECGQAVSDFTDREVLESLQDNASNGIQWVEGEDHPIFQWQKDISTLEEMLEEIESMDWTLAANEAEDAEMAKATLEEKIKELLDCDDVEVEIDTFKAATDGNSGSLDFTVKLTENGISRSVTVEDVAIKGEQAAPSAPILESRTRRSITLQAVEPNANGAEAEYSMDGGETWRDSPVFEGLSAGKAYTFVVRYAETDAFVASPESEAVTFSTKKNSSSSSVESVPESEHKVTVEDGDNGKVTVDPSNAEKGEKVTITVKPDKGYEIDKVIVKDADGEKVELVEKGEGKYTFIMSDSKVEVAVRYKEVEMIPEEVLDVEKIILTIDERLALVFGEPVLNDVPPVIRHDRTMLPIRFVAEALSATVAWDDVQNKVTISKDELTIKIFIGSPYALVNGNPVELDSPAFIENSRTYLPLRFVAENLGATVVWDAAAQTVTITPGE